MLNYIIWDVDPILRIGPITILLYGLMFAIGIMLGAIYLVNNARKIGYSDKHIELLIVMAFVGIFLGARLVHCLFYDFTYYKENVLEILLPIVKTARGGWELSGYHGLASHGGALGVLLVLVVFYFVTKRNVLHITDILAIAAPLLGGFIRIGNLCNSEIVGAATDVPWAFVFTLLDNIPRHPAQLYESVFYFILFTMMAIIYNYQCYKIVRPGFYTSVVFIAIAIFRFFVEFVKEVQVDFESDMLLNLGQWLSVPFFVAGLLMLVLTQNKWVKNK